MFRYLNFGFSRRIQMQVLRAGGMFVLYGFQNNTLIFRSHFEREHAANCSRLSHNQHLVPVLK